ncbi:MAG: class I SAM-dependent methyltransferase [Thermodesulfobacteriota bacterium]
MEMEEIPCPICGESEKVPFHREGFFQMVRCPSCLFIYLNPRPTEGTLYQFYQTYLPEDETSIQGWEEMMRPVFKRAAHLLIRYKAQGKLLDVGSGFGFFLKEMKEKGWKVEGVEISEKAIDYTANVLELKVYPGPLEHIGFSENQFDAITGFYLIEHLPRPMVFLEECYRILKPGGLLLLRYPHTTPIKNLLKLFGIKNRLYDLPAHLSDFSPKTVQLCLEKVGFEECQHLIGGYTLPEDFWKRLASMIFGGFAEFLFYLSGGRYLLPGVSKTVIAFKGVK